MKIEQKLLEELQVKWDSKKTLNALNDCDEVYEKLLTLLAEKLNSYHQEALSIQFYRLTLGFWLQSFIHIVYDHFLGIQQTNSQQQLAQIELTEQVVSWHHLDQVKHHCGYPSDTWQRQLYVSVAREMLKLGSTRQNAFFSNELQNFSHQAIELNSLKWRVWKKLQKLFNPQITICNPYMKISGRWNLMLFHLLTFRSWIWDNFERPYSVNYAIDSEFRKHHFLKAEEEFTTIVGQLIFLYLPAIFLEGFQEFRQKVKQMELPKTQVYYSANSILFDSIFQFHVAEHRSQCRLLLHQHGGHYGTSKFLILEEHERSVCDYFYTWGWKDQTNDKVKHLPPPTFHIVHSKNKRGILFMLGRTPRFTYRLHLEFNPIKQKKDYENSILFLQKIPDDFDLLIRPWPADMGWNFSKMLQDAKIQFAVDDFSQKSLFHMGQRKLVVMNEACTGFLETLASNVPTIVFHSIEPHAFRKEALPYIQQLESVGIFYTSPISAAEQVKQVYPDVESWWNQPEIQKARQEFIYQYARLSQNWLKDWKQEFCRVLKEN